jgi:SAM-dependent methyltransferase
VRNWVQAAQDGKLDLQLFEQNGKLCVANTTKNTTLIQNLVEKGKKYKNRRGFRVVTPTKEFYDSYNQQQILDIISNLSIHNEIPTQYTYVDGAAKYWDDYANRLNTEQTPNILTKTVELLDVAGPNIDRLVDEHRKVNVVDLGPGNGLPIRSTLARLLSLGKLNRYIAIDGSKEMLEILEDNIRKWFGDAVKFEGYVRDFSYERFDDLFVDDYKIKDAVPVNLVCLIGGTLSNFRSPERALHSINSSLGLDDLFIYTGYLDTPNSRRYFDFNTSRPNQKLRSELILGLLNIHESFYEIEQIYDEAKKARSGSFRLKIDLSIKFELGNGGVRYVELQKNTPILLWRHWHNSSTDLIEQFDKNGFDLMLATKTRSQEYLLLASKIKTNMWS